MGGFIKCMKTEYNLGDDKIMDDIIEDEEREFEKLSDLNNISIRHKSESNIRVYENNSNVLHYNENYLDLNGEINRKKSNTVFLKSNLQNNI